MRRGLVRWLPSSKLVLAARSQARVPVSRATTAVLGMLAVVISTVAIDHPRSVTHPDVSAVPWHDHSSSFRIGSGCTLGSCTGGGASASIPNGPLYKCWGPLKVPIGAGKLHRFLPEVDMGLVHHMILFAGRCGSRLIYAWARTGQASGTQPPAPRPLRALRYLCHRPHCALHAPSRHPRCTCFAPRRPRSVSTSTLGTLPRDTATPWVPRLRAGCRRSLTSASRSTTSRGATCPPLTARACASGTRPSLPGP
eukprot:scaffold26268_cov59-Phaeocystis_antarctica.AAC.1